MGLLLCRLFLLLKHPAGNNKQAQAYPHLRGGNGHTVLLGSQCRMHLLYNLGQGGGAYILFGYGQSLLAQNRVSLLDNRILGHIAILKQCST